MTKDYTEDTLVQQTTADYFEQNLGWESVFAYNNETFGPDGLLGRKSDQEVVLTRYLRQKLQELNPDLPDEAYDDAVRQLTSPSASQSLLATNQEMYQLIRDGVQVTFHDAEGQRQKERLKVIDFSNPENNHFLCVRELWVKGDLYRKRMDIMGFVNGIPLLFMECKNIHRNLRAAYDQNFSDYKDTVPHIFHHNAMVVVGNGDKAKIGSISSKWGHFHEWKRLTEDEPGVVDMETLLKGVCTKSTFLDIVENFIMFDTSREGTRKILARNHQYLGVNRAIESVRNREQKDRKLGVFWHTQGSGKSYSMVFFTRKIHRKLGANFTFAILTDRDDLDKQIYQTFVGCGAVNEKEECRASSAKHLKKLLTEHKKYVFSLIQKFREKVNSGDRYSDRDDIIVITDEAHRTQYGDLALNMRNALPRASYIGFTGTPLFKDDEITRRVFGDYVSTYDFQRAVDDKATVPLYYDARGDKLGISKDDLNERMAEKLEELEIEDIDVQQRLEKELKREYHIITAESRLEQIARDFVKHYSKAWESGKVMLVCIDKITCVRMHQLIERFWKERIAELEKEKNKSPDEQEEAALARQIEWMKQTRALVVISEEQGEVAKFKQWNLDIKPHRKLFKDGIDLPDYLRNKPQYRGMQRLSLEDAFKEEDHPFRIVIVCAMWLTGFDVPCLSTLYLDKPLKAHTLMQAIARANRVNEGKNNGMIVDYCGILKNLRKALATFAGKADEGNGGENGDGEIGPTRPESELLGELEEAIQFVRDFLDARGASLDDIIRETGFQKNAAIIKAKEAANENDKERKRFEVMCREVFKKFKACITIEGINNYRDEYGAINIVYKSLQQDRDKADITDIIRDLHKIADEVVETKTESKEEEDRVFDISRIDFDVLRKEFQDSPQQKTTVQNLKQAIDNRLQRLLKQNPLRTDFQQHYEKIVSEYNSEKDRVNIEKTFQALIELAKELSEEQQRAIREGLDEESLAIFDLLKKPDLSPADIRKIKKVASDLLETLKKEKLQIDHWRDKESTRDSVRLAIRDFLWSDKTGLPESCYSEDDVKNKAEEVFHHVYRVYAELPSPYYQEDTAA